MKMSKLCLNLNKSCFFIIWIYYDGVAFDSPYMQNMTVNKSHESVKAKAIFSESYFFCGIEEAKCPDEEWLSQSLFTAKNTRRLSVRTDMMYTI